MAIDALMVVKELRATFSGRDSTRHRATGRIKIVDSMENGGPKAFLVLDPHLSRQALCSTNAINLDYFADALKQLSSRGRVLDSVAMYFRDSPLFMEGEDHRSARRTLTPHVEEICALIRGQTDRVARYFMRHRSRAFTPLHFSQCLVEICFSLSIVRLLDVSLLIARRAIRERASVFFYHFHSARHTRLDQALRRLQGPEAALGSNDPNVRARLTLAQSLVVMGVDPCVAAICGAIVNGTTDDFARSSNRYFPVSFVSRTCAKPFELGSEKVEPGDVLYLSLVHGADEQINMDGHSTPPPISFGAGLHVCAGKPIALAVAELAQAIYPLVRASIHVVPTKALGDGAFLAFSEQS